MCLSIVLTVAAAATVSRNQNASACLLDASALASKQVSVNCGVIVKKKSHFGQHENEKEHRT